MSTLRIDATGIETSDRGLRRFAAQILNLQPFWRQLAKHLADEAQRLWPLRRRTGRLRTSLTWASSRLGRGGVFEADPDSLQFGTSIFYGRFSHVGTKHQRARPIIHVDAADVTLKFATWARDRAVASGMEVT